MASIIETTNPGLFIKKWDSINLGLSYLVLWIPITSLLSSIFGVLSQQTIYFRVFQSLYILFIINALPALKDVLVNKKLMTIIGCVSIIYIISYISCSNEALKSDMNRTILLWCAPYLLMAPAIKNAANLIKCLTYISGLTLIIEGLNCLVFTTVGFYSQDIGYNCVLPIILFFSIYLRENKFYCLLFTLIGIIIVLFSGSRGPLLCALLGIAISYMTILKFNRRSILLIAILFIFFLLYISFKQDILKWAIDVFSSIGVSTRSLEGLLYSEMSEDSIRDSLRKAAWLYAYEHPIIGGGFFADRIYLYNLNIISSSTATVFGSYCHNIFLELLMQFGLIPGFIINLLLYKTLIKIIKKTHDLNFLVCLVSIVGIGLFPLFVSRSWITYPFFYFLIGLLMNSHLAENKYI